MVACFLKHEVDSEGADRIYNVAVAFDGASGEAVATYRKLHLWGRENEVLDASPKPDLACFEVVGGVKVGLMICFDLCFPETYELFHANGIRVVAYPTAWDDELPFDSALSIHPSWAMAHGITLFSAGLHLPDCAAVGSGIFDAKRGILNYVFDPDSGTKLVASKLTLDWRGPNVEKAEREVFKENLALYSFEVLEAGGEHTLNLDLGQGTKCELKYSLDGGTGEGCYVLVGRHGTRYYDDKPPSIGILNCGVVYYSQKPNALTVVEMPTTGIKQ